MKNFLDYRFDGVGRRNGIRGLVATFCLMLLLCAAPIAASANTTAGVNSVSGSSELPIALNGVAGIDLAAPGTTSFPQLSMSNGEVRPNVIVTRFLGIGLTNPTVALDVNGAIRAGPSTTVNQCGPGLAAGEGSQRYNYTTHQMEYCNGTAWVPPSSKPTVVGTYATPVLGNRGWPVTATAPRADLCILSRTWAWDDKHRLQFQCSVTGTPGGSWTVEAEFPDRNAPYASHMQCAMTCYNF